MNSSDTQPPHTLLDDLEESLFITVSIVSELPTHLANTFISIRKFSNECVVNKINVNRALSAGIRAIEQVDARNSRRSLLPGNVGRNWTQTEE